MKNFLEIIVTYHDDREQDIIRFDSNKIDFSISLSNWLLTNLHHIVKPYEFGDIAKFSCWLCDKSAQENQLFIKDLIQNNGKFYFNQ